MCQPSAINLVGQTSNNEKLNDELKKADRSVITKLLVTQSKETRTRKKHYFIFS